MNKILLKASAGILALASAATLAGCGTSIKTVVENAVVSYKNADKFTAGGADLSDKVKKLDINWINGDVIIKTGEIEGVSFEEESNKTLDDESSMYYWLDGSTLHIEYCKSGIKSLPENLSKDLTITLPVTEILKETTINTVSSEINIKEIESDKLIINTVSGDTSIHHSLVDTLDMDTVSGGLNWEIDEVPSSISFDTVSGNCELIVPGTVSATVEFSSVSGEFSSDMYCRAKNGTYTFGKGKATFEYDSVSGCLDVNENVKTE